MIFGHHRKNASKKVAMKKLRPTKVKNTLKPKKNEITQGSKKTTSTQQMRKLKYKLSTLLPSTLRNLTPRRKKNNLVKYISFIF